MRAFCFLLLPLICFAQIQPEEEALALRRIADFWLEGEYQIAKNQIEDYLSAFPESSYFNTLCAALGDLFLREKNHSNALHYYSLITEEEWMHQTFLNRMQCLYHLEWYATLADACEIFLAEPSEGDELTLQATYYLAIALYQQCLNASKNPEQLEILARRAEPHFERLLESNLSNEVSQAFAHLCCILKNFSKASAIYFDLAAKDPQGAEDFLFQAALLQSEFDKEKASQTFERIANLGRYRSRDAAFNYLVLQFEMQRYEELTATKDLLLEQINTEKIPQAHLFFGRSFLALKKNYEAMHELKTFIKSDPPYELLRAGLLPFLEIAQQIDDLASFNFAIEKLSKEDPELPKALFIRAILLKKKGRIEDAKQELQSLLAAHAIFEQKPQTAFELAHLEQQGKNWPACRERAEFFIQNYPSHELALFAWKYFVSSSAQLSLGEDPADSFLKGQLISDLELLLQAPLALQEEERSDWQFLLAKTYYALNMQEKAYDALAPLLELSFPQRANAHLLMALLQKESSPEFFCYYAEEALRLNANLTDKSQLQIALFNAYLARSQTEPELLQKGADHLFSAFQENGQLHPENLLWLGNYYYKEASGANEAANRAALLFEKSELSNKVIYQLATLYANQNRTEAQVRLLEQQDQNNLDPESQLLLAEGYARLGKKTEAASLFNKLVALEPVIRSPTSASACLQLIRLTHTQEETSRTHAATSLKNLILQRNLANEPIHLEAALDYVNLQAENNTEKKLSLLSQTKEEFESTNTLLSKDYQEARLKLTEKNKIYQAYLQFFDAEIYFCQSALAETPSLQKELQAKAKEFFLKIIDSPESHVSLKTRTIDRLQQLQVHEPNA
jgi:tetratricopeptide (TPR) repeat protein